MKRINITVDDETLTVLEEEKKKGVPFSFTVRGALLQYRGVSNPPPNAVKRHAAKETPAFVPITKEQNEMMAEFIKKADTK